MTRSRRPGHSSSLAESVGGRNPPAQWAVDDSYSEAVGLFQRGELALARAAIDRYLESRPACQAGLNLKGIIASQLKLWDEAEAVFRRLTAEHPDFIDAFSNLGFLLKLRGRYGEAETCLRRVIEAQPGHAGAWLNLGIVLQALARFDDAEACNLRVLEIEPESAQAWFNLGCMRQRRCDFAAAHAAYRKALAINPQHPGAGNNLVFSSHYVSDLTADDRFAEAHQLGLSLAHGVLPLALTPRAPLAGRPLRVGLVSGDLRDHPVGYFLEAVLAAVDSSRIAFHAYSNHAAEDGLSARLRVRCAGWHAVDTWSDEALARRIDMDGIDILIDLSGHSAHNRLALFARRPAPVQVAWLGYFATTGMPAMDYVIADPHCVPPGEERWFSEKVWRLPVSRFCFSPPAEAAAVSPLPAMSGRPFTFGCYQHLAKINDRVLALWGRILASTPGARLRLQTPRFAEADSVAEFRRRLGAFGIEEARVELHGAVPRAAYFASHGDVDLLLDTFPYTGGTTTCEAMWVGVPTLSLATPGMLGRQGAALLAAVGLNEFVCADEARYVAEAVAWAGEGRRSRLAEIRAGLRGRMLASPLMDALRFACDLAAALYGMHAEKLGAGEPTV